MGRLDGKVCVITGAGGGMGADAAELFTEEGAKVCVADVNLEAAEQVADGGMILRESTVDHVVRDCVALAPQVVAVEASNQKRSGR